MIYIANFKFNCLLSLFWGYYVLDLKVALRLQSLSQHHESYLWRQIVLHVSVRVSEKMEEMRVINDFSHEHPLVFKEDMENDAHKEAVCSRCDEPVLGPCYNCSQCNFLLHKSCNELPPLQLHNDRLHPNHTLVLRAPSKSNHCDVCLRNCIRRLFYRCEQCDFDLDVKCVSRWRSSIDECRRHDFVPIIKQIQFTCDACGEKTEGNAYLCSVCRFMVHPRCSRYTRTISTTVHKHSLTLTCSLRQMVEEKDEILCALCRRKVKTKYAVYYCQDCRYAVHFQCAERYKGEYMDLTESVPSESDWVSEIEHFSHEHKLIISKEELENDKMCEGCMVSISPPFYSCEQCNFFLHGRCTILPSKKQNRLLHEHPLTLHSQANSPSGIFRCLPCGRIQHGFCYRCDFCNFYKMDIQCSSLPETLKHKGHQHSLSLALNRDRIICNGCYKGHPPRHLFVCTECEEFGLCVRCATLPYRVGYEFDLHLFLTLKYEVEDDSGEYYCFICEESRDSRQWFYYCKECDFAAHPRCVISKYSRIKFGRTFKCDRYHRHHPLTIVQKNEYSPPCDNCGNTFDGLAVECTQCKINFHLKVYWGSEHVCNMEGYIYKRM